MTDVLSKNERSRVMSKIKGQDTEPEMLVSSLVHRMGYRFRLHLRDLPGCPDIVLQKHKKLIFVHGCFWHGHKNCKRAARPSTNTKFWNDKLSKNMARDKRNLTALRQLGWRCLIVWGCQCKSPSLLLRKLETFLREQ